MREAEIKRDRATRREASWPFKAISYLCLWVPGTVVAADPPRAETEKLPELHAECWFNAQPARIHDRTKLMLVEFWTARSSECRSLIPWMQRLHDAYDDGRLLIVGLTADDCDDAERFIRRHKFTYKIGAESRSVKDYSVKEPPVILLIDLQKQATLGRWSGKEVDRDDIAKTVREFLGAPKESFESHGALMAEDREVFQVRVETLSQQLADITASILSSQGELEPDFALSPFDHFYSSNLPGDAALSEGERRAMDYARGALLGHGMDVGLGALHASGRLSDAAKSAMRDRVLDIAGKDPDASVRLYAAGALRRFIGRPGDPALLDGLRRLQTTEKNPMVRAAIEDALESLASEEASRQFASRPPTAAKLCRQLNQPQDRSTSPWRDALEYRDSVPQRTTQQLLEDYRRFVDPADDEIGRQNATIKRAEALGEVYRRIVRGEIDDRREVQTQLVQALESEPDPTIRTDVIWDGLKALAERGGTTARSDVLSLLESRLPAESDRQVRATMELAVAELKDR